MGYTIAIIEDDMDLADQLVQLIRLNGYNAQKCVDFQNAMEWLKSNLFDLVLLDINIPYLSGQTLLPLIKSELKLPVVMLTSSSDEINEVLSMSHGADDYITKPFNSTILLLRIANILRRYHHQDTIDRFVDLSYDPTSLSLSCAGQTIELTRNEALIMQQLIHHAPNIVSRNTLMDTLWENESYINDNALNVNISRLRDKLVRLDTSCTIITRKQAGYCLCEK